MIFKEGLGRGAKAFSVKDGLFPVSFKLTHLVLLEVGYKVTLVLSHDILRKKVGDSQKLKEFEEVSFFG